MISQNQILRLAETHEYRQLVDRVLTNGRCRSPVAGSAMRKPEVVAVAGLGLALQRLAELTYRPTPAAAQVAMRLVSMQRHDGLFGASNGQSSASLLAATAVALRGLITWHSHTSHSGWTPAPDAAESIARGLAGLASLVRPGAMLADEAIGWAIVLWQLGDVMDFRRAVDTDSLLQRVHESGAELVEDELCRFARAMAA